MTVGRWPDQRQGQGCGSVAGEEERVRDLKRQERRDEGTYWEWEQAQEVGDDPLVEDSAAAP